MVFALYSYPLDRSVIACTATAPAPNKNCTIPDSYREAKSTPYLSCHRDSFPAKVPGPPDSYRVARWLRQVTCLPCSLAPRYPDITFRDLTLGPLYCRAVRLSKNPP